MLILLYIIVSNSEIEERDFIFDKIENDELVQIDDIIVNSYYSKFDFYFYFPSNFDKNTQEVFLMNFKENPVFTKYNFTLLEPDMNFTSYKEEYDSYNDYYGDYKKTKRYKGFTSKKELKVNVYQSEKEIEEHYRSSYEFQYNSPSEMYGIVFTSPTDYNIRFSYDSGSEMYEELVVRENQYYYQRYIDITTLQVLVDRALIKTYTEPSSYKEYNITSKYMDRDGYKITYNNDMLLNYLSLFMLFYFVPCVCSLLNQLVIEKESKIKESLVIIGLKRSSFWVSWAITYGTIIIISSILVSIAMTCSKLFMYIDWSILISTMLLFGISCCCISFILSTFIEKSKTANTVGVMIIVGFFVMYFIYRAVDKMPTAKWICIYTLSPVSFLSLFKYFASIEGQGLKYNFFNMLSNHSTRSCFFGLVFTLILYFLLAVYLDNVLPQGNNFHKKWHFIITDFFHKKNERIISKSTEKTDNPFIEKDPEGLQKAVEVKGIIKNFKVKGENIEILKNVNFNGYYNEIFCILGHNGAGKTTLMSIMTGILSATEGEVYYDGVPITGNETDVCKQFGYCPQFDTFNNNLTVGEHVKLFAGIKGVKVDVKTTLKNIDLLEKKDNFPKELSGGQRRKLCITLALLGSPKFIFLDEPTTGLDPYSRKTIWELLSKNKKDCIMFVTTHYMDEADLLADRKMIISNGNITCLGTSLFLKNSFNMNYSLDIHAKEANDSTYTDNIIKNYCPEAVQTKIITNTNAYVHKTTNDGDNAEMASNSIEEDCIITYLLPIKLSKNFKNIFQDLNQLIKSDDNGIVNFSLTAPTLEELFVKLENNDGNPNIQNVKGTAVVNMNEIANTNNDGNSNVQNVEGTAVVNMNEMTNNNNSDENNELINKLNPVFGKTTKYKPSNITQICSIVKLRIKIFLRNKTFALLYTVLPICLIIVCIYFENKVISMLNATTEYEPLEIGPKLYDKVYWFKDTSSRGVASDIIDKIEDTSKISLKSANYENELTIKSGKLTSDLKYIGGFKGYMDDQDMLQFTLFKNITYKFSSPVAVNMIHNAMLKQYNSDKQISVVYKPFASSNSEVEYDGDDENGLFNIGPELIRQIIEPILIVAMAIAISLSVSIYGPLTVKEREEGINYQLFLNGTKRINYWIGILLSDFLCLIVPIFLIDIAGMINNISIYNSKVILYTIFATMIWAISSLLHQYILSYFFKKYEKVSSLFIIINPILSLFIGIYAMVVALLTSLTILDEDENSETKSTYNKMQYRFYLILILYAPASIVLFYTKLSSFIITSRLSITQEDITSFLLSEEVISLLGNQDISEKDRSEKLTKLFFDRKMPSLLDVFTAKDNFILLIVAALVLIGFYALILFTMEKINIKFLKKNKNNDKEDRAILDKKLEDGPPDVLNEWKKVKSVIEGNNTNSKIALKVFQLNKDFFISLKKMKKQYDKDKKKENKANKKDERTAFEKMDDRITYDRHKKIYINRIVDDVTFGVNEGECLGLLGPNGAGKTTSISMITGLLSHTHGKIVYGNRDLNETETADLSLGYCAQHDALWSLLTVKETLNFYLNICGYPKKEIPQYIQSMVEACGIESHINKKVSEISGGTKRKLSLLIAICSSPSYLILDEPSAGMDPFTRRYMWKLISELKKVRETATILTTHSTEEAEALCERIAILIKGRLVCVDTPRSIKMNHSNSYTLEVFTDNPDKFEQEYVKDKNIFGLGPDENYELESSMSYQKYSIKMKIENIANVFAVMENAKENGVISQYNFGQYSLEQVFINFVNKSE